MNFKFISTVLLLSLIMIGLESNYKDEEITLIRYIVYSIINSAVLYLINPNDNIYTIIGIYILSYVILIRVYKSIYYNV